MFMNPNSLMKELDQSIKLLEDKNEDLKELSSIKAETEKQYKIRKAKEVLILKAKNTPVGLVDTLAEGTKEVADLKFKKDIAENNYYICLSAIDNLRQEIEVLRSVLSWVRVEYLNN